MIPSGIDPATIRFVAQYLNQFYYLVPRTILNTLKILWLNMYLVKQLTVKTTYAKVNNINRINPWITELKTSYFWELGKICTDIFKIIFANFFVIP
jgi:hypothetical protein